MTDDIKQPTPEEIRDAFAGQKTKPLADAIREISEALRERDGDDHHLVGEETLRDAAELLNCLARLCERGYLGIQAVHKCFGAPGDFGYSHPIGKALAVAYGVKH